MSKVATTIIEEELELVSPFLPINRHRKKHQSLSMRREQERPKRERVVAKGRSPAALCSSV